MRVPHTNRSLALSLLVAVVALAFCVSLVAGLTCEELSGVLDVKEDSPNACFKREGTATLLAYPILERSKAAECRDFLKNKGAWGEELWASLGDAAKEVFLGPGSGRHIADVLLREHCADSKGKEITDGAGQVVDKAKALTDTNKEPVLTPKQMEEAHEVIAQLRSVWYVETDSGKKEAAQKALGKLVCKARYTQAAALAAEYSKGDLLAEAKNAIKQSGVKVEPGKEDGVAQAMVKFLTDANRVFEYSVLPDVLSPTPDTVGKKTRLALVHDAIRHISYKSVQRFFQLLEDSNDKHSTNSLYTRSALGAGALLSDTNLHMAPEAKKDAKDLAQGDRLSLALDKTNFRARIFGTMFDSAALATLGGILTQVRSNIKKLMGFEEGGEDVADLLEAAKVLHAVLAKEECNAFAGKPNEEFPIKYQDTFNGPGWPWVKSVGGKAVGSVKEVPAVYEPGVVGPKCHILGAQLPDPIDHRFETTIKSAGPKDVFEYIDQGINDAHVLAGVTPPGFELGFMETIKKLGMTHVHSPSGHTAKELGRARYVLNKDEMEVFKLLMLEWMVQARDHSSFEILSGADSNAFHWKGQCCELYQRKNPGTWHKFYSTVLGDGGSTKYKLAKFEPLEVKSAKGETAIIPGYDAVELSNEDLVAAFKERGKCLPEFYFGKEFLTFLTTKYLATDDETERFKLLYAFDQQHCGLLTGKQPYCSLRNEEGHLVDEKATLYLEKGGDARVEPPAIKSVNEQLEKDATFLDSLEAVLTAVVGIEGGGDILHDVSMQILADEVVVPPAVVPACDVPLKAATSSEAFPCSALRASQSSKDSNVADPATIEVLMQDEDEKHNPLMKGKKSSYNVQFTLDKGAHYAGHPIVVPNSAKSSEMCCLRSCRDGTIDEAPIRQLFAYPAFPPLKQGSDKEEEQQEKNEEQEDQQEEQNGKPNQEEEDEADTPGDYQGDTPDVMYKWTC